MKAKLRSDDSVAADPQEIWVIDCVDDELATGLKFRILMVVDTGSRNYSAIDARFNCRGEDMVNMLERVCSEIGYSAVIM